MNYVNLTCQCGYTDDLDKFLRTRISGELPPGHYQCPSCNYAWKRKTSEHRILRAGSEAIIIPGKVELVPVEGRL